MRFDITVLIKLHDAMQFIDKGNLETDAAADAIDCSVDVTDHETLLAHIKAMEPTREEILSGLGFEEGTDLYNQVGEEQISNLVAIYTK